MGRKSVLFFLALSALWFLTASSPDKRPAPAPARPRTEAEGARLERLLNRSPSFAAFQLRVGRPCWMVEEREPEYWVVAYGESFPTHFARSGTLRIYRSGPILRWSFEDDAWMPDT